MFKHLRRIASAVAVLGTVFATNVFNPPAANAQETIKIAFVAPFSGPVAPQGDAWLKMLRYAMDNVNARGGALGKKFELVTFDDKITPSEALIALKSVADPN